jgi:hypothetical protein
MNFKRPVFSESVFEKTSLLAAGFLIEKYCVEILVLIQDILYHYAFLEGVLSHCMAYQVGMHRVLQL